MEGGDTSQSRKRERPDVSDVEASKRRAAIRQDLDAGKLINHRSERMH
jgi:hypothetical protein